MNAPLETYWQKAWNRPQYFFLWLAIFSGAALSFGLVLDIAAPDFPPPLWFQAFAVLCAVILALCLVTGVLCFILSWIPPVERLLARMLQRRWLILVCFI